MAKIPSNGDGALVRKLRAHKKSRQGCRNCKIRAVKCDETKPICKRCKTYGVVCSYNRQSSDLELSSNASFSVSILNDITSSTETHVPKSIAPSLRQGLAASLYSNAQYELGDSEFELLHRFQTRTVMTVTTPRSLPIYRSPILKYAYSHPCLLHAVLSLTLLHDRYLSSTPRDSALTVKEAYQWDQTLKLYSKAISSPIPASSRDALWATAAFLGILTLSHIEAQSPKDIWPYAPPSSLDLNWLRMGEGKKQIWKDGKAFAQESEFRVMAIEQQGNYQPGLQYGTDQGLKALPFKLISYLGLVHDSDLIANPYHATTYTLAQTWNISSPFPIIVNYLFYITSMESRYKHLLEFKDSRALLILAYWYRLVAETGHWFLMRRAYLECESICLYLMREHAEDRRLQELLHFPSSIWSLMNPSSPRSASEVESDLTSDMISVF